MVFRFPLHWFCIFLGILCCTYAAISNRSLSETITDYPSIEPPIIIDAGHGGADGGAVAIDGTAESSINLQIALKLEKLSNLFGVPNVMTRTSEEVDYPENANSIAEKKVADQNTRLRLIQDYPHGILYSIHQNTYPSEKVSGVQVLYGHSEESRILGTLMQDQLNQTLNPDSRRAAAEISNEIFLLRNCTCTAVLIECGFISNPKECRSLQTDSYQKKIVFALLASYFQYLTT